MSISFRPLYVAVVSLIVLVVLANRSASMLHSFKKAAVCSDGSPCSRIGKSILERNGSAVDAAIATLFCNGIFNMQSMGIGGGFLMTIYIRESKTAVALNARESAPLKATPDMFKNDSDASKYGPLAIAVPGKVRGSWTAYKKFGKLPWKELVQPAIDLCEKGYKMSHAQFKVLHYIRNDSNLREWFLQPNGKFKPEGSIIKPKQLCNTLKIIAENGGDDLYNGTVSKMFLQDLKVFGAIVTREDLDNYTPKWQDPISIKFKSEDRLFSISPPGSGVILGFILNILDGYNFTAKSIDGINNTVLTYHRIVEAFKYAYAKRTQLGDPAFVNITQLVQNLTSTEYANEIRSKINDDRTSTDPAEYGAVFYNQSEHGTSQICVIAGNGDAVSVTSTINLYFGNGFSAKSTGIIFNSGMDDFASAGIESWYGLPGSPNNEIAPGKRSVSSKCPSIITDKNGDVRMVVGAGGGTKITTSVALVIMRSLWFDQNLKEAVDAPRFHHQMYPMKIFYEHNNSSVIQQIIIGLEALGHNVSIYYDSKGSTVCALLKKHGVILGNADFRKEGDVFGLR